MRRGAAETDARPGKFIQEGSEAREEAFAGALRVQAVGVGAGLHLKGVLAVGGQRAAACCALAERSGAPPPGHAV